MRRFIISCRCFAQDERGATAIEYALIAGGVSITILASVTTLGETIMTTFYDGLSTLF